MATCDTANCTGDQYVQNIERTECIGNSLVKINNNFKNLDLAICGIGSTYVNQLSAGNNIILTPSSGKGNLIRIDALSFRPQYIPLTGVETGGVVGTGNLSTVTGLTYDTGYSTKSGSVTYDISKLQGTGLNPARITNLHIVADVRMYADNVARKANLYVTYPNSGYVPLLQTLIDAGIGSPKNAEVATSVRTTCIVPVNQDTTTVTLSVQTNYAAHGERAFYEIIGATTF